MWAGVGQTWITHQLEHSLFDYSIFKFNKTWILFAIPLKPSLSQVIFDFCDLIRAIRKIFWSYTTVEPLYSLLKRSHLLVRLSPLHLAAPFLIVWVVCQKALKFFDVNRVLTYIHVPELGFLVWESILFEVFLNSHTVDVSKMYPLWFFIRNARRTSYLIFLMV